ncbi:hypothetical protein QR66_08170, partial [Chromobacterium piscinae]
SMDGMGAAYIKGLLTVGQIDTKGMMIRDWNGNVVVDMTGMEASYIRNLMVDTLQIKGEAVSKNDTRSVTLSGSGWKFDYYFDFYCSDAGTVLVFADSSIVSGNITLYGRDRSVPLGSSAVLVLTVSAGEWLRLGVRTDWAGGSGRGVLRYGCVLFRR